MSIFTSSTTLMHRAERTVIDVPDGARVDVTVKVDEHLDDGTVCIETTGLVWRLGRVSCRHKGEVLIVSCNRPQSGVKVKNTGSAIATGGGFANSGIYIGDAPEMLPASDAYRPAASDVVVRKVSRPKLRLVITVAPGHPYAMR